MDEEEIIERWRDLVEKAEANAARAMSDTSWARLNGYEFEFLVKPGGEPPYVSFLRQAAKKLIPSSYKWEIVVAIGGAAYVVLTDYKAG